MRRIPAGDVVWSLRRYTRNENLWDRVCFGCKQTTPVFEYEHLNIQEHHEGQQRTAFSYLCEECAQKKLAGWLYHSPPSTSEYAGSQMDFDIATVFYEQKNDGETLVLTRWSAEQRRRRLQGNEA